MNLCTRKNKIRLKKERAKVINFVYQLFIQNKIKKYNNNTLLHGAELTWPSSFGI